MIERKKEGAGEARRGEETEEAVQRGRRLLEICRENKGKVNEQRLWGDASEETAKRWV